MESNDHRMMRKLLESGAEIDVCEKLPDGCPVLLHAIRRNFSNDMILYLLDKAEPNMLLRQKDGEGHDIEWYILRYKNTAAREKLERIKEIRRQVHGWFVFTEKK